MKRRILKKQFKRWFFSYIRGRDFELRKERKDVLSARQTRTTEEGWSRKYFEADFSQCTLFEHDDGVDCDGRLASWGTFVFVRLLRWGRDGKRLAAKFKEIEFAQRDAAAEAAGY